MKILGGLLLIFSACNTPDFKNFSELGELRIMGIVADQPEIDGTRTDNVQVVLTPYISDIYGEGRKFTVVVAGCLDPGISQGASPRCLNPKFEAYPNGNTFDSSALAKSNYTGAMDAVTITISNPAAQIAGFSAQQRYNGINYLVVFRLEYGATNLTAVKSISISERPKLNRNPEIAAIVFDEEQAANTLKSVDIDVSFTEAGGQEDYQEMSADGSVASLSESYFITWFYYLAEIKPSRILLGQQSKYKNEVSPYTIVAVVKDRRGGTAVRVKNVF